ncbi:MAG: large conductance mechanosensitive channel protein MscL [Anaerolineales bacterium]|nr:large conductance mechanosensitive channel protein MscL [Anaerolineales bacterium]
MFKKTINDFKNFVSRGNVIDLAVAVIIGGAFGKIVNSFVDDIFMPPIGLLLNGTDFSNLFLQIKPGTPAGPYITLEEAKAAGAITVNYGSFLTVLISFLIIAFTMFLLIKAITKMERIIPEKKEDNGLEELTTKECPYCLSEVPAKAVKCKFCTSDLE